MTRQKGFAHLFVLVAALGILIFLLISSMAPFKDKLFSLLYQKPSSFATTTNTLSLDPVADTYVDDAKRSTNFGKSTTLVIDNAPDVVYAFFKFDLTPLAGKTINSATFKFKTTSVSNSGTSQRVNINLVNNTSWDENQVTWRNKPASSKNSLARFSRVPANSWFSVPLSKLVVQTKLGGLFAFSIKTGEGDNLLISSRETTNKPQLIIVYQDAGSTPPPSSTPAPIPSPSQSMTPNPLPSASSTPRPTPTPIPTCQPRPICLDTVPPCLITEPIGGWCPTSTPTPVPTPVPPPGTVFWKPALNTSWQWQLTGLPVDQSVNVTMYDIDLFDNAASVVSSLHAQGRKVVCYFSAGSYENWRPDASSFPAAVKGKSNGWPGENWLDIRNLTVLGPIMRARLDLCKQKGFDSVEPDNIDGYTNSTGFPLTAADQITYNKFLATEAHNRGLSIALKNDVDQINDLLPYFDWALNEECFSYNECSGYSAFINAGKAVMQVEYDMATSKFCPQANSMNFNSLLKDLDLTAYRVACR